MKNFEKSPLKIIIKKSGGSTVMAWMGKSDFRHPASYLMPYVDDFIHSLTAKELTVDFKQLEYMNSSTVPPLLHLLKNLNERGVKTNVIYNKKERWQVMSFKAFETLAKMLEHIEVEGT